MSAGQIRSCLDSLETRLGKARDAIIEGADPTEGSADETLHGLYLLRMAFLTLRELRGYIEPTLPPDDGRGEPSEISEMASALASRRAPQ